MTVMNVGVGFASFIGFSYSLIDYKYDQEFNDTFDGQTTSVDLKNKADGADYRLGVTGVLAGLDIGAFFHYKK
jgi:hypothetical protein